MIKITSNIMLNKIERLKQYWEKNGAIFSFKKVGFEFSNKCNKEYNKWVKSKLRQRRYREKWGAATPDPYKLIMVDPQMIEYNTKPSFSSELSKYGTYILAGEWDIIRSNKQWEKKSHNENRLLKEYEYKNDIFISIKQRFIHDKNWWDTPLGERFQKGDEYRSITGNPEERFNKIERLYESIKKDGFKCQTELELGLSRYSVPEYNDVCINICRDGKLAFESNGHHRVSIAKILELEKIPVRVLVRHENWQETRRKYIEKKNIEGGSLQEDIGSHPDIKEFV